MPELPEVEVTRRRIGKLLVGRKIARVVTTKPSYFFLTSPQKLVQELRGQSVERLDRHGKYLLARLSGGGSLLLHLGMTGQLFGEGASSIRLMRAPDRRSKKTEKPRGFEPDEHTHLQFEFADRGPRVFFRDVRKFGKVLLIGAGKTDERLEKLGIDALVANGHHLYEAARARKIPIKSLLLDQAVIAGIGNIYADEALFLAGVSPRRSARRVDAEACTAIVAAAQKVMRRSIQTGGSSISDYVTPDGSDGGYQNERRVYGRENEPCPTCATPIRRVVIATRSSCFCPNCQK
ncbi:MAG TPA: bifunctional DNA-formamidopyrimidine glycosylase/DNA-(apurinic or apyrimidinic site) lyase [Polyangiaceae bacterium]|nr:bifunctional DNA-formamidopyrimidine glycosylase/DNA-(apurinic or apyrimidinic site) lyase [Polyangiaceae bacterium]